MRKEVSVAWNIRNIDLGCLNIAFLVSWHSTLQRKPRLERLSGTSRLRRPERISDVPLAGWMKRIISRGPISRIRASLTRIDVVQRGWNALGNTRFTIDFGLIAGGDLSHFYTRELGPRSSRKTKLPVLARFNNRRESLR